jgi:serine/threonine protein kinase
LRQLLTDDAGADRTQLVAHVGACRSCQRRLDELAGASPALLNVIRGWQRASEAEEPSLRRLLDDLGRRADPATLYLTHGLSAEATGRTTEVPESLARLGGYDVTGVLGQGGMGVVFQAFDPSLRRWVAIKVLAPDMANDGVARQRFAREAQAAAAVRHQHVVTIHAVSETEGLPYLVMEYLAGGSLQDYLDRHGPPSWRVVARLGAEVAEGLAAAHAQGLVHRDVKPSNILLHAAEEEPGSAKISDFGLARAADGSRLTRTGLLAGTPMYMSPEQALGEPLDERSDLFSLGSVLYALATGREPFPGGSPVVVLRQVCETTPEPLRGLNADIPEWLEQVIERLHAKRRDERFGSAAEVAELLRYNLEHAEQPRPVPRPHRPVRTRRRRLLLPALALVLILGGWWLVVGGWKRNPQPPASPTTNHQSPTTPTERATLKGHIGPVWSIAFSPDGQTVVTGCDDSVLRLWDAATGQELGRLEGHDGAVYALAFASSGRLLVSGGGDGALRLWDVAERRERSRLPHGTGTVRRLAVSCDDLLAATGGNPQTIELWDLKTGKLRQALPGRHGTIQAVAFAADGRTLATADAVGLVQLWDVATGAEVNHFDGDPVGLRALAFAPDGRTLASSGTGDRNVKLWDVTDRKAADRRPTASLSGPGDVALCLAFSPDGALLAAGLRDGTVVLADVRTARIVTTFRAHQGIVLALAFSPDGHTLATAGEDRLGKLWNVEDLTH